MDIHGAAPLGGHVVASTVRNAASTTLAMRSRSASASVLAQMSSIGSQRWEFFSPSWLPSRGLRLRSVYSQGLLKRTASFSSSVFIPYVGSAFVAVHTVPHWLQGFAQHQPITPLAETLRGLLLGTRVGSNG
jgi:ABC-2 type transport system permease protein